MYLTGNEVRIQEHFNFDWQFQLVSDASHTIGKKELEQYRRVKLPHDWSVEYPFDEHSDTCGSGGYVRAGIGWYKKVFQVAPQAVGKRITLCFEGAYMLTEVWLNGTYLGKHVYGYTPFEWDITQLLSYEGDNVLDVKVDNSIQPNSRWYTGSGITRNVWLKATQEVHIPSYGTYVYSQNVSSEEAVLSVETSIAALLVRNEGEIRPLSYKNITLITRIYDRESWEVGIAEDIIAEINDKEQVLCKQEIKITKPILWEVENPYCYTVVSELYTNHHLLDRYTTVTGIRDARFDCHKGFLLNRTQVKINGVCVHHDGGSLGAAVPKAVWRRRLEKLKGMGVNAVRMSHNPPDPALLDLCDELGFLVMDEAFDEWRILKGKELGSNTHESRGYSEWFEENHVLDLEAMLYRDRNHPSIIIWSIGNEVPDQTAPEGHLLARKLKEICHRLDPTRRVTQANDQISAEPKAATQEFLDELDVVGYNYTGRWRKRAETFYYEDKINHPDWCVIGTENTSASGIRGGYHLERPEGLWWGREPYYSVPVTVGKLLKFTMTHDYVAGDFMWTGIDYLGEAHWPARSACAGVLDTCGFEKGNYYFYQSIWRRNVPMVHLEPHWNMTVEQGTIIPVLGYTNCDYAELFLNGKSYGKKAYSYPAYGMTEQYAHFDKEPRVLNTDDLFLSWDVPYEPGAIMLVGYQDGKEVCRKTIHTAGEPVKIAARAYQKEINADGLEVAQIEVDLLDQEGHFCPTANMKLQYKISGPAEIVGIDNGNPESLESFQADNGTTFHGKAFLVLRSTGENGNCSVTVTGEDLESAEISITFQ